MTITISHCMNLRPLLQKNIDILKIMKLTSNEIII